MTARCGSMKPDHVARRCSGCKKVYRRRYRDGLPPMTRHYANPARCAFCGLAAGNSLGLPVYRYPLGRHRYYGGRQTTLTIGSIGLCDRCIRENATLSARAA